MQEVKTKVLQALMKLGKPPRPGEIAQAAGLPKDEVSQANKGAQGKEERKITSPKRCGYAPMGG